MNLNKSDIDIQLIRDRPNGGMHFEDSYYMRLIHMPTGIQVIIPPPSYLKLTRSQYDQREYGYQVLEMMISDCIGPTEHPEQVTGNTFK